jgi:hypothetical protein
MDDKNVISGLAFQCPYKNRLNECLLYYMEGKSFIEKLALIKEMDLREKAEILKKHMNCRNKFNGYEKWQA